MTASSGVALVGLLSALAAQSAVQSRPAPFVLGVFYEGDIILPVARFNGTRWLNTWPAAEDYDGDVSALKDIPVRWLGKPVPAKWTVWFTNGETVPVNLKGAELIGGCVTPPALSVAEHLATPAGAFDEVHPAVAVDTAQRVEPLHRLNAGREWDAINPLVMTAAKDVSGRAAPIHWLYRAGPDEGQATYFFETTVARSETTLVVRGWLVPRPGGRLVVSGAALVDCRSEEAESLSCQIPIGVLRLGGREVWLLEYPTGETTNFELWEVGVANAEPVLRFHAGGC